MKIKILKEDRFIKKKKEIKTGRVCGRAVNTSNYGAGGSPVALILQPRTSFHFVSLHPGVKMGTGEILLGVNPAVAQYPVQQ